MRRRCTWHDTEYLPGQFERDRKLGRNAFYVYVLDTDYGQYIGHTGNIRARIQAHNNNEVRSTAGGNAELIWQSGRYSAREEVLGFEAALTAESLRDQESERFLDITGFAPVPFQGYRVEANKGGGTTLGLLAKGCGVILGLLAIVIGILVMLFVV